MRGSWHGLFVAVPAAAFHHGLSQNYFVSKPFVRKDIFRVIERAFGVRTEPQLHTSSLGLLCLSLCNADSLSCLQELRHYHLSHCNRGTIRPRPAHQALESAKCLKCPR